MADSNRLQGGGLPVLLVRNVFLSDGKGGLGSTFYDMQPKSIASAHACALLHWPSTPIVSHAETGSARPCLFAFTCASASLLLHLRKLLRAFVFAVRFLLSLAHAQHFTLPERHKTHALSRCSLADISPTPLAYPQLSTGDSLIKKWGEVMGRCQSVMSQDPALWDVCADWYRVKGDEERVCVRAWA